MQPTRLMAFLAGGTEFMVEMDPNRDGYRRVVSRRLSRAAVIDLYNSFRRHDSRPMGNPYSFTIRRDDDQELHLY